MLRSIRIQGFKRFEDVTLELGPAVVFVGPNNSGKTTALQALALWQFGLNTWMERRKQDTTAQKRRGVTVNRKDIVSVPVPNSIHLWRNLNVSHTSEGSAGGKTSERLQIVITVQGDSEDGLPWSLGMRFHYDGPETLRCEPLWPEGADMEQAQAQARQVAGDVEIQLLPPMSGLASTEFHLQEGAVLQLLGQGKSADVLRNLCYAVHTPQRKDPTPSPDPTPTRDGWARIRAHMKDLFGVDLDPPELVLRRGEITLSYSQNGARGLDISAAGRGLQQTLLLLAWLYRSRPGSVLLLDEPDAHLEFLRQRQIYGVLQEIARERRCQIIAASHSEVVLDEAMERHDHVIAFVGKPHAVGRPDQLRKALRTIRWDHYILAEQTGWVLYCEGATDLEILRCFAQQLGHTRALDALARPFVHWVQQISKAAEHYHGLREACPDLVGVVVMDRQERDPPSSDDRLPVYTWTRREIENYLAIPEVLIQYARSLAVGTLFEADFGAVMRECIQRNVSPAAFEDRGHVYWKNVKATDDLLDIVLKEFSARVKRPLVLSKGRYHELVKYVPKEQTDPEIREMLDRIAAVAERARPRS